MKSLALAAALLIGATPALVAQPGTILSGETKTGELTADSPVMDDGSAYETYAFAAEAGTAYVILMRSDAFDAYLHVGTGAGASFETLYSDDDSGGGTDARIRFVPTRSGTYHIRANALMQGSYGTYTLSLAPAPPPRPMGPPIALTLGQVMAGELMHDDPVRDNGSYAHLYSFAAKAGTRYEIVMMSGDFDTFLEILNAEGRMLVQNDDADRGEGTNSRIVWMADTDATLQVRASGLSSAETGDYTLLVREVAPVRLATDGILRPQQTLYGTLTGNSQRNEEGRHTAVYTFTVGAMGQSWSFTARSGDFDTYLQIGILRDGVLTELSHDDDGGGQTDSQIIHTFQRAGTYVVVVSALQPGNSGHFTLRANREE